MTNRTVSIMMHTAKPTAYLLLFCFGSIDNYNQPFVFIQRRLRTRTTNTEQIQPNTIQQIQYHKYSQKMGGNLELRGKKALCTVLSVLKAVLEELKQC